MTRKKVKLAYINNDSARKATFKKRKRGLLKKVTELSTLCDVDACAVIYSPYDAAPEVHPSPLGAARVLARFRRMPEMDQSKKMVNQESFLRQRISKAADQLKRLRKENREKDMTALMFRNLTTAAGGAGAARAFQGLSVMELNDLGWLIEQSLKDVGKQLEKVRGKMKREMEELAAAEQARMKAVVSGPTAAAGSRAQALAKKLRTFRGSKVAAEERVAVPTQKFGAAHVAAPGSSMQKQPWFMDLMMNHQDHHDQMMNLAFGENAGQWANGFYP